MFEKDIERGIQGVIVVGQKTEDTIYQELNEYVVTEELNKHFSEFFANYSRGIMSPTNDIGVWISGFFGSGKSHFLKILSYLLDSNLIVNGRKPIDFFETDGKIKDPIVLGNMKTVSNISTDVILFNIDSKSSSQSNSNKDSIVNVFIKVFNEMRGYCGSLPFLAKLEQKLDEAGKFDQFKEEFKRINGNSWEDTRDDYYFIQDEIIKSIVATGFMGEDEAKRWADNAEENIDLSIENFANEINNYCNSKGNNHHIVFLVDEVGQYIAENTKLMLNLQTVVEDLGSKCNGKAWVIVTSQQNIDEISKKFVNQDFSKIQARFKTRLSLSSSNVDEVIRRRILSKNDVAEQKLESEYIDFEASLKNIISFEKSAEMKNYQDARDFASIYPFIPYQFNLVQNVLTSIRLHSSNAGHMADGERSMLALFQESAIKIKDKSDGALVPLNIFYEAIQEFIDHTYRIVINKAVDNDLLNSFDVEVLKVLFLIKYIKEIKASSKNITTLMISNVKEDRIELNKKIDKSLNKLLEQTLIQKNGDIYSFLTNEEQDIRREIKKQIVDPGEILDDASNRIFTEIYSKTKYKYSQRYNFSFNQSIDDRDKNSKKYPIGMRIITPYYEAVDNIKDGEMTLDNASNNIYNILKGLSDTNNEVIVQLPNDDAVLREIKETLQIHKFLTKNSSDLSPEIRAHIQEEYTDKIERINVFLEEAIRNSIIYVKGDKVEILTKNAKDRLDEAMGKLVKKVYNKLTYMDFSPDKKDIMEVLKSEVQESFEFVDNTSSNALADLEGDIKLQTSLHEVISFKNILNRFSNVPYGFNDLDIQWLTAKLFSQKRISLTINSEELSIKKDGSQKIFDYITKKEYSEKLLLSIVEKPPEKKIKAVKNVLKEVFNFNKSIDDPEVLMETFNDYNEEKLSEISEIMVEYNYEDKYPGKIVLDTAVNLFTEVKSKKTMKSFYDYVFVNEDEFYEIYEDLDPVLSFFKSSQKNIFSESLDIDEIYEDNKTFIDDSELINIAEDIKKILIMPSPYSQIKNLPELNNSFTEKFNILLEKEREDVLNHIDSQFNLAMEGLVTKELKDKFENKFKNDFDSLRNKVSLKKNISVVKSLKNEADALVEKCYNLIENYVPEKPQTTPTGPKPKKVRMVSIKSLASKDNVSINNEDDVDQFLKIIGDRIKSQLNDETILKLKL